jgi:(p)ppGpp synthase/HD superfamily hydrolase|tara:strand:+ start:581 stop:1108 length:528 start_codon:yes stop_codon:yes gene_type:complete
MKDKQLIQDALMLAIKAHDGQRRKYTGEAYASHPIGVSKIIETIPDHTPEMVAAALLHDVVEDTYVTFSEIKNDFGSVVAEYVHYCTNVSEKEDGNREFRKKMDADHFALGPPEAQTIKVADLIHNSETIIPHDPKFFHKAYKYEKQYLLTVLTGANSVLRSHAQSVLDKAWDKS